MLSVNKHISQGQFPDGSRRPTIVVDLDYTLCDARQREHLIPTERAPGAFDEYCKACTEDEPIVWVVDMVRFLQQTYDIVILSGRQEVALYETIRWLHRFGLYPVEIILRPTHDHRRNEVIKREQLAELLKRRTIWGVMDDNAGFIDAAADLGIPGMWVSFPNNPHAARISDSHIEAPLPPELLDRSEL